MACSREVREVHGAVSWLETPSARCSTPHSSRTASPLGVQRSGNVHVCMCTMHVPSAFRDQNNVLDALELELQMVVSHHL